MMLLSVRSITAWAFRTTTATVTLGNECTSFTSSAEITSTMSDVADFTSAELIEQKLNGMHYTRAMLAGTFPKERAKAQFNRIAVRLQLSNITLELRAT